MSFIILISHKSTGSKLKFKNRKCNLNVKVETRIFFVIQQYSPFFLVQKSLFVYPFHLSIFVHHRCLML